MGTWGSGNFQNDAAWDYVGEIEDSLTEKMAAIIANPELAEPDEDSSAQVMVAVEVTALLCEYCNAFAPPEPDLIALCQETYLRVWDDSIDYLTTNSTYKSERREVIKASFEKLLRISQEWHSRHS